MGDNRMDVDKGVVEVMQFLDHASDNVQRRFDAIANALQHETHVSYVKGSLTELYMEWTQGNNALVVRLQHDVIRIKPIDSRKQQCLFLDTPWDEAIIGALQRELAKLL